MPRNIQCLHPWCEREWSCTRSVVVFILSLTSAWRPELLSRSVMTHGDSWRLAVVGRCKPHFPVPLMQTPTAPTNPRHSTNFGTMHHPKSNSASPSHPKWCGSKIPPSLSPNWVRVWLDPNNNGCELPHWAWGTHVGFVMDGSPRNHYIL